MYAYCYKLIIPEEKRRCVIGSSTLINIFICIYTNIFSHKLIKLYHYLPTYKVRMARL